jgi:hypothetical protein
LERDDASFAAGCDAARADVAAGRLVYHWSGHAGHWGHWFVTQLADRFGVGVESFGICFVTESGLSFDEGYNCVLIAEIDHRHGRGAFQSVIDEAKVQSEVYLANARQAWLEKDGQA